MMRRSIFLLLSALAITACSADYDVIIHGGILYDGSGSAPVVTDLAIEADTIAAIGSLPDARGRIELDASGLAVAPGFINIHNAN